MRVVHQNVHNMDLVSKIQGFRWLHYIPRCTSWDTALWDSDHHSLSAPRTRYWSWNWRPTTAAEL